MREVHARRAWQWKLSDALHCLTPVFSATPEVAKLMLCPAQCSSKKTWTFAPGLVPSLPPPLPPACVPACRPASRQAAALGTAPQTPRSCSGWGSRLGGCGWSPSCPSTAAGAHTGAGRTAVGQGAKGVSAEGSRWETSLTLCFPGPRQRP